MELRVVSLLRFRAKGEEPSKTIRGYGVGRGGNTK
uniref:Uncharacterized protein n=1 Tax=Rhizophora mucronata TaxID=61149 RepID=A0A2P2KDQ0_RHIMU